MRGESSFLVGVGIAIVVTLSACGPQLTYRHVPSMESRSDAPIIGGIEVKPTETPALTTVIIYDPTARALCTGTLVGNNLVITAAHCLRNYPQNLQVVFATNLNKATQEMARPVVGAIAHPLWPTGRLKPKDTGDIALIKFHGTTPNGYRSATFLPNTSALRNGAPVVLSGYGISDAAKKTGFGILRQVATTIVNPQFSSSEVQVEQRQGRGACHGDSGGPAFIVSNGVYYLWGIMSQGVQEQNAQCNAFSVFTNLTIYYKWLQEAAKALSQKNQFIFVPEMTQRTFGNGNYY